MRQMLLLDMLAELRLEARISADLSHGTHLAPRYAALLRRIQEELYLANDWPNLDTVADVTVAAGQRYAAYPDLFEFEGIRSVFQREVDGDWSALGYGIRADELNEVDSNAGETRTNVLRWQNYLSPLAEEINLNMFEVWPVPDRPVTIRFEGKRRLLPLTDIMTHTSTLDGIVVVLHAAGEVLAGQKAEDAALKIEKAQRRIDVLRKSMAAPNANRMLPNGGSNQSRHRAPGQRFRAPGT